MMDRSAGDGSDRAAPSPENSDSGMPLEVVVGLGDPGRAHALLPRLSEAGDITVVARCLTADQVLAAVQRGAGAVALIAFDLHRLGSDTLAELTRTGIPLVLLAPDSPRWSPSGGFTGLVLPLDADPSAIRQTLWAAVRGERRSRLPIGAAGRVGTVDSSEGDSSASTESLMLAVASGPGSPGRTTIAINLATALGAVAPTVLVDADLSGPSVAAYLDLDPTRNLAMLAHAEPATPERWDRAIAQETQPLAARSPHGVVLCGLPKLEMRASLSRRFFEELIDELRARYRYVIVDLGADLLSADLLVQRTALGIAEQTLLVGAADLVGLWRTRTGLDLLQNYLHLSSERIALVINRHRARDHHPRSEIEWALGVATAAVIPEDPAGARRAVTDQHPLVLDRRSQAGRALIDLAERIHAGEIALPPEIEATRGLRWLAWADPRGLRWPGRPSVPRNEEVGKA